MPVGAGSPDQGGEIWSLGFLLALFELRWPELEVVKRSTTPSNKIVVFVFLQVWFLSAAASPLTGRGGEGWWICVEGSAMVRADRVCCLLWPALVPRGVGGAALGALIWLRSLSLALRPAGGASPILLLRTTVAARGEEDGRGCCMRDLGARGISRSSSCG
jgi:hypothetical protein